MFSSIHLSSNNIVNISFEIIPTAFSTLLHSNTICTASRTSLPSIRSFSHRREKKLQKKLHNDKSSNIYLF